MAADYPHLLLEGGPSLNGVVFFHTSLVDEFFLTLLPLLMGGPRRPTAAVVSDAPHTRSSAFACGAPRNGAMKCSFATCAENLLSDRPLECAGGLNSIPVA
jgi:hypothetical protein